MTQVTMSAVLRVHFFQHIQGEGLGSLASWLQRQQAQVSCTEFFALSSEQQPDLPNIDQVDLLVIMGGAMSVNDEADYAWLVAEKAWIRQYITQGKPVVGLCLGAQLIASALGATVKRNRYSEIGWWPVQRVAVSQDSDVPIFNFPRQLVPLSWHGDSVELPDGALLLAKSAACPHQAYQLGTHVLAFQFHPESTPDNARLFAEDEDYQQMVGGQYVQSLAQIIGVSDQQFIAPNQLLERAVEFVLAGVTIV